MVETDLLRRIDYFRDLDAASLEEIAAVAEERKLERGDVLFAEGDEPNEMFVVTSGRLAIANRSVGRESMLALLEAGEVVGELPLFDGLDRSADARALEPSSVIAIPYAPLRRRYEDQPQLLWKVVEVLARRLRKMDMALADTVFLDVTGRTAKRLLDAAGEADEFSLPVTQEELAGMVGASRERVNKAIASFIRLGWIEQRDGRYLIVNRDQLTLRAN